MFKYDKVQANFSPKNKKMTRCFAYYRAHSHTHTHIHCMPWTFTANISHFDIRLLSSNAEYGLMFAPQMLNQIISGDLNEMALSALYQHTHNTMSTKKKCSNCSHTISEYARSYATIFSATFVSLWCNLSAPCQWKWFQSKQILW